MNKENLNRNISSILQKGHPLKPKEEPTHLSFRHLSNKNLLTLEPRLDVAPISPISSKRNKTITSKLDLSGVNTEPSDSIILNSNPGNGSLVEAFKMER